MWKPASSAPAVSYFLRMQIRRPLATTLLVAVMVSGCASPPVTRPTASPVPTTTPVFASEAEALEAAREAYAAYLEVSDQILSEGGAEPGRIESVAVAEAAVGTERSANTFRSKGLRQVGRSQFDLESLQRFDQTAKQFPPAVVAYVCLDISNVDVLDGGGKSLVEAGRPPQIALVVEFASREQSNAGLVVASTAAWDGAGVCGE